MTNLIVTDFVNPKQLQQPNGSMEYIVIHKPRKEAIAEFERRYPWINSADLFYHVPTATLFCPACFVAVKA